MSRLELQLCEVDALLFSWLLAKHMSNHVKTLIFVGTNKSGTSSIFRYLADHPSICPTKKKQSDYFLDIDYPWVFSTAKTKNFQTEGASYDDCFEEYHSETLFRLDVSPDYMYSAGSAEAIARDCGITDPQIFFILRNPVDRFISWYKFAKQQVLIPEETSLADFLALQKMDGSGTLVESALYTGFYSKFIPDFVKMFHSDNIRILFYEDMVASPSEFMLLLSSELGIEAEFYRDYEFLQLNRSQSVRFPFIHKCYVYLYRKVHPAIQYSDVLRRCFGGVAKIVSGLYRAANMSDQNVDISHENRREIRLLYKDEYRALLEIGVLHKWN